MAVPTLFSFLGNDLSTFTPKDIEDICPICTVAYGTNSSETPQDVVTTPCHHNFHRSCLDVWLETGSEDIATCPCCRQRLCKRPVVSADNILRSLNPSLSENWTEEKWEAIWAVERFMRSGITSRIQKFVHLVVRGLSDEAECETGEAPTNLPWVEVFEQALSDYRLAMLYYYHKEMPSADKNETTEERATFFLYPGSVGEYVTAREILRAIENSYNDRKWDISTVSSALRQFREWQDEETTSIQQTYRRADVIALVDGMEDKNQGDGREAFQRQYNQLMRIREAVLSM
jgi:hypothetical protein